MVDPKDKVDVHQEVQTEAPKVEATPFQEVPGTPEPDEGSDQWWADIIHAAVQQLNRGGPDNEVRILEAYVNDAFPGAEGNIISGILRSILNKPGVVSVSHEPTQDVLSRRAMVLTWMNHSSMGFPKEKMKEVARTLLESLTTKHDVEKALSGEK